MGTTPDHKLHKVLARFPWRRRKPRGSAGLAPIAILTKEGRRLWANPNDLAEFDDPGPALVCVAIREDPTSHVLVRGLVEHHAAAAGVALPDSGPELTSEGIAIIHGLWETAGLNPKEPVGPHPLGELVDATWAIAAATGAE